MVQVGVQVIDPDRVDAQGLHQGGVTKTDVLVRERVAAVTGVISGTSTRLIGDTDDLEGVASLGVDELVALHLERLHGSH